MLRMDSVGKGAHNWLTGKVILLSTECHEPHPQRSQGKQQTTSTREQING